MDSSTASNARARITAHLEALDADTREEWAERAAIMEHGARGMSRESAELLAYYRVCERRGIEPVITRQMSLLGA